MIRSRKPLNTCLLVLGLLVFGASGQASGQEAAEGDAPRVRALLSPHQETVLSSQIPGRIDSLPVAEGGRFKKGQTLVSLDCSLHRSEHRKAKADLGAARKTLEAKRRLQELRSGSDLDVALAQADLAKAEAELAASRAMLRMCSVTAPFPGRVAARRVEPYQNVQAGEPVLEILDDSRWKVEMIVPSAWLRWLAPGTPFRVHLEETGKTYPAELARIGARIDPASQSVKVTGELDGNPPDLLAGMSGTAVFER